MKRGQGRKGTRQRKCAREWAGGRRFAAQHAECVFLNGQSVAGVKAIVDDIRALAVAAGRQADDIQFFLGATVVTGATDAEAQDLFAEYRQHVSSEAALVHAAASLGVDLARFDLDEPVDASASNAITSNDGQLCTVLGMGLTGVQPGWQAVQGTRASIRWPGWTGPRKACSSKTSCGKRSELSGSRRKARRVI